MSKTTRGGHTLKTGKIGRVNCLRQQLLMPGERMNISMNGSVRLESLRERDVMRINAHLATFMTPVRWLYSQWPDYVKNGADGGLTLPQEAWSDWSAIGVGAYDAVPLAVVSLYPDAYLKIVNEWYKWPEESDYIATDIGANGVKAVPLSKIWSRLRYDATPDEVADYETASVTEFDVRTLAETQAKFRSAMKRDVLSFNRWMELINETWKGNGSREVDQVPIMLDQTEVGVNPREIPATDGASLGQWQSLFDFNVDHQIKGITAPEHCIITTMLTIRFAATTESRMPLATTFVPTWHDRIGDPEYLAAARPVAVTRRELFPNVSSTELGFAPAGWQWRCDHDVIGKSIDIRDSFPYSLVPVTKEECKDATRVKSAFRSQALDDYIVDVFFKENGYQPIGDTMDSYFSGMADDVQTGTGSRNNEFPKGGKQL